MRRSVLLATLLTLPLWANPSLAADDTIQSAPTRVQLRGTVLDATRAPIAGARVTATADGKTGSSVATTDPRGEFTFALEPGRYTVKVVADGFLELSQTLSADAATSGTSRELVLQIAGVRDSVTVSAAPGRYSVPVVTSATKTPTPLRDVPQSVTVVTEELIKDQLMMSVGDVMRYVPGIGVHQGENNRDQIIIRGNSSSADFFVDGVRDDVQYYRDLYNLDRVEALKGPNAMMFGRGGAGGVVNRVTKEALFRPERRGLDAGRHVRQQAGDRRPRPAVERQGGLPRQRDVRGLGQLPRQRRLEAPRHHADPHLRAEQPHHDQRPLRVPR